MSPAFLLLAGCFLLPERRQAMPWMPCVVGELVLIPLHPAFVQREGSREKKDLDEALLLSTRSRVIKQSKGSKLVEGLVLWSHL